MIDRTDGSCSWGFNRGIKPGFIPGIRLGLIPSVAGKRLGACGDEGSCGVPGGLFTTQLSIIAQAL